MRHITRLFTTAIAAVFLLSAATACSNNSLIKSGVISKGAPFHTPDGYETIDYDTMSAALLALNAGQIDNIILPESTADYISANNDGFIKQKLESDITIVIQMAVKQNNSELLASVNDGIKAMEDDGTIERLREAYIDKYAAGEEILAIEQTVTESDKTIKVAITGDCPPLDYITPEGNAAGYNVAFLNELCARIGVNYELVQIDSAARITALAAETTDLVFWYPSEIRASEITPELTVPAPDGLLLSRIYFHSPTCCVVKK